MSSNKAVRVSYSQQLIAKEQHDLRLGKISGRLEEGANEGCRETTIRNGERCGCSSLVDE